MTDIRCYIDASDRFTKDLIVKKCQCLPDCASITYDLEISQTPIQFINSNGDISHWGRKNESEYNATILTNQYKNNVIIIQFTAATHY